MWGGLFIYHISTRYQVKSAGTVVDLNSHRNEVYKHTCGLRGRVKVWSRQSRGRLIKFVSAIDWKSLGEQVLVSLTYPRGYFDGKKVKRDLRALYDRWRRKFGEPLGVWKLEFQRRGAPHIHLLLGYKGDLSSVREWLSLAWYQVVKSGDKKHLLAGTSVESWDGKAPIYFAGYCSKGSKEYQNTLPDEDSPFGRWWGAWGVQPDWKIESISYRHFMRLRRSLWGLRRSRNKGRRLNKSTGRNGAWSWGISQVDKLIELAR